MADVNDAARALADALRAKAPQAAVRWRWGDVLAVGGDGTMSATIDGGAVDSIVSTRNTAEAEADDRVLVLYLGSEAVAMALGGAPKEYPAGSLGGSGTNQFYARGHVATLMSAGTTPSAQWGSAAVCTIPEGFRPAVRLYFPTAKTGAPASDSYIEVAEDGTVTVQNWGGTQAAREYRATCTWTY